MNAARLVLASSSRYRAAQLSQLGLSFDTCSPAIDEASMPGESAPALALRLSEQKADAVAARYPEAWVLAGDQTAVCQDHILGKPGNLARARIQLQQIQGQICHFYSAFCLSTPGQRFTKVVTTEVQVRPISDETIERYLAKEPALDCAGSFKIEGLGISLFEAVRSDDPSALVGLPLISVAHALRACGWAIP